MKKDHCATVTIIFVLSSSVIIISSSHSYHHHYHHRSQGKYIYTLPKNLYIVQAVGRGAWSTIFIHNTFRGFCFHRIYNIVLYAKVDIFLHYHLITTRASCFPENSRLYYMTWFATSLKWIIFSEYLAFHCIQYAPLCFSHLMEQIQKLLDLFLLAIGHKALNWANIKISIICFIRFSLNKRIQS